MKYLRIVYTFLIFSGLILSSIPLSMASKPSIPIHGPPTTHQGPNPSANITGETPFRPGINDDVSVSATVSSPAGVDPNKVRLIYSYRDKGIGGNLTMTGSSSGFTPSVFTSITQISATQKEANYTYVSDFIDHVNIKLNVQGGGNPHFIAYSYSYLDISSSSWIELGSDSGVTNKTLNFEHTGVISGFKFSTIVERSGKLPDDPSFDTSSIIEAYNSYTATIPAPGLSTAIDYYIQASDLDSSVFYSMNKTIYSNTQPSFVTYNNLPAVIPHDRPFLLNITARDPDGYSQLTGVIAYFRPSSDTNWQDAMLSFNRHLNSTDAIFTGFLNVTSLPATEGDLEIYLNITDSVDGSAQLPVMSSQTSVFLDSQGPILQQPITISASPMINNTIGINSTISLNMTFVDSNGIKRADIVYSLNGGVAKTEPLLNSTSIQPSSTSASYSYVFPQFSQSTNISFYFETEDYVGNTFNSSVYHLSIDGNGPVLLNQQVITTNKNNPSIKVFYNTWDTVGLQSQQVYYQYLNDTSWQKIASSTINYDKYIDKQETFELKRKPPAKDIGSIADANTTLFALPISPSFVAQDAILDIELTHQRPSDLEIYLKYLDSNYLISDRQNRSSIVLSLTNYLSLSSLGSGNLTIEVHDVKTGATGVMNSISLHFLSYTIPFGYTYMIDLPTPNFNTTVLYYMILEDNLGNQRNTSIFSVAYIVTTPNTPTISDLTLYSGVIDARGRGSLPVSVTVTNHNLIDSMSLMYKYIGTGQWSSVEMSLGTGSDVFTSKLPLSNSNGTLFYQVAIVDTSGNIVYSKTYEFQYINANAGIKLLTDISHPLDLSGGNSLRLDIQVEVISNITKVHLIYKINGGQENNETMGKVSDTQYAYFIIVNSQKGKIEFYFIGVAGDHNIVTSVYSLSFVRSTDPSSLIPYIVVGGVAVISTSYVMIKRIKKKSHISHRKPAT